jgi:membrane protease subunit HflK
MSEEFNPNRYLPKLSPLVIIIIIIVVAVIALGTQSFYLVEANQKAVILRFGEYLETKGPGLKFKIPLIEQNYNVDVTNLFTLEFGYRTEKAGVETILSTGDYSEESIMLTGDKNIVDVQWQIQYQIVDPVAWLFNVEEEYREKTIRDITSSVINQLIGDQAILEINKRRNELVETSKRLMNERFQKYNLGIEIKNIPMQDILPPEGPVRDAFEDVNKAEQDMETYIKEGELTRNKAIEEAIGKARAIIEEAEGYYHMRVNTAEGDVARFLKVLEEYRKDPWLTKKRLYIEMWEEVFGDMEGTDLIDKNLKNFIPFKDLSELGDLGTGGQE